MRAVHLRGTGDHVLHVIGVAGAIDVGVMAVVGLVLDVGGVEIVMPRARFLGGRVDLVVGRGRGALPVLARTVVMAAVSVVLPWSTWPMVPTLHVRLVPLEFGLGHDPNLRRPARAQGLV